MKKKQKILITISIVIGLALLGYVFRYLLDKEATKQNISAVVTEVFDRPNIAEDGSYIITAQDDAGYVYSINATGYLNTPLQPESQGESCVDIPKVQKGDHISFYLPAVKGQPFKYDICHDKDERGYNFRVE